MSLPTNLAGLLASPQGKKLRVLEGDYWNRIGTPETFYSGDNEIQGMYGADEYNWLRSRGLTPQQAKEQGWKRVVGEYGGDKTSLYSYVDPNGKLVAPRVETGKGWKGGLGEFLALTAMAVPGLNALGSTIAGGAAGGAAVAPTVAAAPASSSMGGLFSGLEGLAADSAATALTGGTLGGFGSGLGGIEAALASTGGLGGALGLAPSLLAAAPAAGGAGGVAGGASAAGGAAGGASGVGGMLSGLLDNPLVKAGLIGAGALAGGQKQDGEKLTTTNKIDPRMDPYVYGPGGILPQAQAWYQNNKTGINPDMTAGWNMQKSILTDPTIQSRLRGMLAQQPMAVAGNPFTSGSNPYLARGM